MAKGFALFWMLGVTFVAAALGSAATTFLGRLWSFLGLALLASLALVVSVWPARRSWRRI